MAYAEDSYGRGGAGRDDLDGLGEDGPAEETVGDRGLFRRDEPEGYGRESAGYGRESAAYGREPEGYGRESAGYGREGAGYEGGMGYEREGEMYEGGRGGGYGRPTSEAYADPAEASDLGTGVMENDIRGSADYGSGYGRSEVAGAGYGGGRVGGYGESEEDREELDDERKHKRIAEAAAAAAVGYGVYEHHQKSEAEDKLEELGYDSDGKKKHHHHLFG